LTSALAGGCTSCPRGCTYIFPCKLRLKKFFHRPVGCRCTHCTPGYAYVVRLIFKKNNGEPLTTGTSYNVPVQSVRTVSAAPRYASEAVSRKRSVCGGERGAVTREIATYQTRTSATSDSDDVDDTAATATIHQVPEALSDDTRWRYYFYGHPHYSSANALSV